MHPSGQSKVPSFPFLCLTVSGGHTQIVLVRDYFDMQIIGQTIDDAAGETFDKAAKIMGLPYPGGPVIDKLAEEGDPSQVHVLKARHIRARLQFQRAEDIHPLFPAG